MTHNIGNNIKYNETMHATVSDVLKSRNSFFNVNETSFTNFFCRGFMQILGKPFECLKIFKTVILQIIFQYNWKRYLGRYKTSMKKISCEKNNV